MGACDPSSQVAIDSNAVVTVLLVRHAERADTSRNANLMADSNQPRKGIGRADNLRAIATANKVSHIISTGYCRTMQTIAPTARSLNIVVDVIVKQGSTPEFNRCLPDIKVANRVRAIGVIDPRPLAQLIRALPMGSTVLVAGHSNTIPALAEALGVKSFCSQFLKLESSQNTRQNTHQDTHLESHTCQIPHGRYGDVYRLRLNVDGQLLEADQFTF